MKVSIVIPNWNGRHLIEKNLPSVIEASKIKSNNILEIIVVDDGSTDTSVQFLTSNYKKDIRLIKHTKNRGFSEAVNTGARSAKGEIICLLNSDVSVTKDFLKAANSHFSDELVFAVGLHENGYGPAKDYFKNGFVEHRGGKESQKVENTFWASGGSALFKRSIWFELKGMDSTLFAPFYWEDVDLSYRAQKRGYKVLWEPNSLVHHNHEGVTNESNFNKVYMGRIKERNQIIFIWKNITSKNLRKKHFRGLLMRAIKHPGYFRIIFMALAKREEIRKANKKEASESTVSDESIFSKFA